MKPFSVAATAPSRARTIDLSATAATVAWIVAVLVLETTSTATVWASSHKTTLLPFVMSEEKTLTNAQR
jgi:hypothetical protein